MSWPWPPRRRSERGCITLLISLEGQVPGLIEGARDVVKSRCHCYQLRGERQVLINCEDG